jgi:hypothetical protein
MKFERFLCRPMLLAAAFSLPLALASRAHAEPQQPGAQAMMSSQRAAMEALSFMDGAWRGSAWTGTPDGKRHTLTQTERVGPLLGGTVKLVEGRGYETDGRTSFNALGVISYNPATRKYSIQSYASGMAGAFPLEATGKGFVWQIPAGPNAIVRFTATFERGTWHEIGERVVEGAPPMKIFEMRLTRLGDSAWPGADAVPPRAAKPR